MDKQRFVEKYLSIAYSLSAVLGATSAITAGIAWGHWKETLDYCGFLGGRTNCSCILYGRNTLTYFQGKNMNTSSSKYSLMTQSVSTCYLPLLFICTFFICFQI